MTAPHIVDPAGLLGQALADASPDLMRELLQTMINALLSADADAVVGAQYGRPTPGRVSQGMTTRAGAVTTGWVLPEAAGAPMLREGPPDGTQLRPRPPRP